MRFKYVHKSLLEIICWSRIYYIVVFVYYDNPMWFFYGVNNNKNIFVLSCKITKFKGYVGVAASIAERLALRTAILKTRVRILVRPSSNFMEI